MRNLFSILFILLAFTATAQQAPDFTFTGTDGQQFNLYTELGKGKTVLIDFFFADCTPCQTYTPMVEQLYKDYGSGTGKLLVVGISDRDDNLKLKQFDQAYGVTYPSAGAEGGGDSITNLFMNWFTFTAWPTYAVVCPDTSISWNVPKSQGLPEIRAAIDACPEAQTSIGAIQQQLEKISIYPMPANEILYIKHILSSSAKLVLTDLTGRKVVEMQLHVSENTTAVSLPGVKAGVYLLCITADGAHYTQKVIIQNK